MRGFPQINYPELLVMIIKHECCLNIASMTIFRFLYSFAEAVQMKRKRKKVYRHVESEETHALHVILQVVITSEGLVLMSMKSYK